MSSLGDLLLGKVSEPSRGPSPTESRPHKNQSNKQDESSPKGRKGHIVSPTKAWPQIEETSNDARDGTQQSLSQKVFPCRIEKNNIAEDCQSNASSVDDYVAELLDPNDRPKNVWHVVEGPRDLPDRSDQQTGAASKHHPSLDENDDRQQSDDSYGPPSPPNGDQSGHNSNSHTKNMMNTTQATHLNAEPYHDGEESNLTSDNMKSSRAKGDGYQRNKDRSTQDGDLTRESTHVRSPAQSKGRQGSAERERSLGRDSERERSKSSRRNRHIKDDEGNQDRHRRDRDRRRSSDRHSKSRHRRDYSDDEEEISRRGHRHRRSDRSRRRLDSRSRSRSRSHSISRRRDRSRSNSHSPVTKRNSRTILIMQLSPQVKERDLEDYFSDIGRVREVRLIMDSKTRRHKGIAYIEFDSAASAAKALALNGHKFNDVPMQIQSALSERVRGSDWHSSPSSHRHHLSNHISQSASSSSSHNISRSTLPPNSYRVYFGGLHVGITEEMLRTIVEPFGMVHKIEVIKDRATGISRGYAFVTFASVEDGQEAVRNLDGFELAGKGLRVSKSTEKGER